MPESHVRALMEAYPRIYFACHTRHVQDPSTKALLSAHQASILDHLDDVDSVSVGELAQHLGVTPSTVSIHIDRLAAKGYVERSRDAVDGRCVRLRLTSKGVRIRAAKSVLDPARVRALLACLTKDDQAKGIAGLELLARAAASAMERQSRARRVGSAS